MTTWPKSPAATAKEIEKPFRDAGKVLHDLIKGVQANNKPLANRAQALLNDVVDLAVQIALKRK
jgi:hypothetical protein